MAPRMQSSAAGWMPIPLPDPKNLHTVSVTQKREAPDCIVEWLGAHFCCAALCSYLFGFPFPGHGDDIPEGKGLGWQREF